jgi:soluble lytic murein transglycosylase
VVLRRLDLLDSMGLRDEWQAEYIAATRSFAGQPAALITLAEGVRDRGHAVQAINLGWQLLNLRNREWDIRLLRVVYPFPYRDLIEDEARRYGIDAMLFAGLIRQESTFRPEIKSRVGATGLSQIMPATGRGLAPSIGIRDFDPSMLEVPEVNARMGAKYLGDMLRRYGGTQDLALAAYNAGPGRADRWRRELPSRDRDAFREAIPFAETRGYVQVVLRNAEIYRRIYPNR